MASSNACTISCTRIPRTVSSSVNPDAANASACEFQLSRTTTLEFDVTTIDLQRGPLLLETLFSNEPIERDAHVALARQLLDSVRAR